MKFLKASLFILVATVLFTSCQKEYSLEGVSVKFPVGSWQFKDSAIQYTGNIDTAFIDSAGNTKTLNLIGTSLTGGEIFSLQLLSTENFKPGTYRASLSEAELEYSTAVKTIYQADQLSGEFIITITLLANDRIEGTFSGLAQDSSGNVTQLTLGRFSSALIIGSGTTAAAGTLGSVSGNCEPVTPNGTYTQGIALTALNTVQVQVTVTTPGIYNISTNIVNGVSFSAAGTFTTTGLQNVILTGTGTPVDSSNQNFTVTFNTSLCNFTINFLPGTIIPPQGDYFPTTVNSNWTYGFVGGGPADSFRVNAIAYAPAFDGNTYSTNTSVFFPFTDPADDSSYYRKTGGDYYEYGDIGTDLGLDPLFGEYIFLKDNVPMNTVWQSPVFSGSFSGVPVSGYVEMTLLAQAVPATVGSLNFPDVIKVKYEFFYSTPPLPPTSAGTEERWFAKGVGLIYDELSPSNIIQIGSYQVF